MYLIIDTETSGLFDFARPADAEGQPRLASIAAIKCDENLRVLHAKCHLILPDGWTMPPDAERVNGLSTELLARHGIPAHLMLRQYLEEIESGSVVIAHNAQYDTKIMRGELRRAGLPDLYDKTAHICTMQALTDICAIPSPRGRGYKWPKLSEAVERCLNRKQTGAHGALHDAMDCLDLARWLKERGALPQPATALAA